MNYKEIETKIKDALNQNNFQQFNEIIIDLWNHEQDHVFFRLFVNYDYAKNGVLTKALFENMKQ